MTTDPEDIDIDLMKSLIPYNKVGELEVNWTPYSDSHTGIEEALDPTELLGTKWAYRININKLKKLSTKISQVYIEYEFYGERYFTETVSTQGKNKREVDMHYEHIHIVDEVSQDFLDYLDEVELKFNICIKPFLDFKETPISTGDTEICHNLGIFHAHEEQNNFENHDIKKLKAQNRELQFQLAEKNREILELKNKLENESKIVKELRIAKELDSKYN